MEWKVLVSTFLVVFLAELGDKTQLAIFGMAASSHSRLLVLVGASAALLTASVIAVMVGESLFRLVPPFWFKRAAGLGFLVLGVAFLLTRG